MKINKDLQLIVLAPKYVKKKEIDEIVKKNNEWIEKAIEKTSNILKNTLEISKEVKDDLRNNAKAVFPRKVDYWCKILNVEAKGVKITSAKTRWGSCSYNNYINFSLYTMLLDDALIDYIVVHELAHIVEKNHSVNFYKVVESVLPNYKSLIVKLRKFERENIIKDI
ncbi:MAG: M48 family metallopeptidase [Lachnospirales bacterium]